MFFDNAGQATPECRDHFCPECRAGKHANCDGIAWCGLIDEAIPCGCPHGAGE